MPQNPNPIPQPSFAKWLKSPTTALLMVVTNALCALLFLFVTVISKNTDKSDKNCEKQIVFLQSEMSKKDEIIDQLRDDQNKFTTALIFKTTQIKIRDRVIDSLKIDNRYENKD